MEGGLISCLFTESLMGRQDTAISLFALSTPKTTSSQRVSVNCLRGTCIWETSRLLPLWHHRILRERQPEKSGAPFLAFEIWDFINLLLILTQVPFWDSFLWNSAAAGWPSSGTVLLLSSRSSQDYLATHVSATQTVVRGSQSSQREITLWKIHSVLLVLVCQVPITCKKVFLTSKNLVCDCEFSCALLKTPLTN